MAQTIKLKRSSVSGNTPSTSDLELGEVAINTYDGKMFIKKNDGSDSIVEIGGGGGSGTVTEAFKTIAVSGQSNVVADSATDTLTLVAGSNMTITTNASGDTITFASSGSGGSQNLFNTFAVSGQNSVVADSTTDTLTFVAGSGITLTTDNSADSITIAATASAITVQDEGSALSTAATTLNFVGAGVTATGTGATKTITIPGGSGNSFGTIAVSGQGSVIADQANDTLTLVAGSNVTLTTSAAGDSVTIASSGGGSASVDAGAAITEFKFDVSSSTTSFSGSDANSNTLAYTAGAVQVYLNGILLDPATDYTATNGTSIVLTDAAVSGDDLQIIAFNRKILNANTTVNTFTGDGTTTAFTLSTDPVNENNTNIFIDGVYQSKSNYSVSGTTLTFSTAPPNGSGIEVSLGFQQASISSTLDFDDNAILRLGTGNDLQLLHDGSNSIIKDTGTGDLQIGASTLEVKNAALNETMIKAIEDGAVELYHNNAKKLETVTGGVTVTGTVTATTFSGDLSGTINTATTGTTQSASDNSTKIATTAYVDTAVTNLVDSAPGTLNTLNELAAALGDDANFSTTITNSLATKVGQTATTGAATIPAGTTAQRPGSPAAGQFRYNSTLSQFEGYTSSWGAIGGGGTNTFTTDIFTANGSTTAFTLTQAVSSPNDCIVHIDGIYQTPTDAYTVSGTTLTFSSAPANTRKIVVYSVKAGVSGNNLNIETFSGDGSATSFTMSINPINENNTIVHIDGVYQQKTSYSTSGTTLSFSAAPANGTTIEVATFTQTEINVPVNDTIDTIHIKDDAVTSAKLGGNLVAPGTVTASAGFVGPLTGNVTGNVSGTAATVTGAAQTNITSVGTLSSLAVNGNVGIGTTNPADALHILDTSGHAYASVARSTQSQGEVGLRLRGGTSGNDWYIYQKSSNNNLNFYNTSDRMTIDSSGNVGINNTSPSHKLDVHGANNTIIASLDHTGFSSRQAGLPGRFMVGPFGNGYPWAGYNVSHVGNTLTRLAADYAWAISYGNNNKLSFNGAANSSAGSAITWTELGYFDINGKFSPRQQIEVGVFSNSQTNSGEAWIGRAADRQDGTLTIQLGGDSATSTRFEIVDRAWSKVISYISGEAPADSLYVTTGGDLHFGGYNQGRIKASGNSVFIDAIPANSHLIFRNGGSVEKMHITDTGSVYHPEQGSNGDYTSYIGSISNSGSGNRYAHVNISTAAGDMFWIEVIGYDYAHSSGSIYGRSGGYIYLYTTSTTVYSSVLNGDIVAHYQLTNGTYEVVVDTKRTGTTNRWGSMVFRGGTDTITATQPLEIIQYSYTGTSAKVY